MAIFGELILILLGIGFIAIGILVNALSIGYSGKVEWRGLIPLITGSYIIYIAIHYGPLGLIITH